MHAMCMRERSNWGACQATGLSLFIHATHSETLVPHFHVSHVFMRPVSSIAAMMCAILDDTQSRLLVIHSALNPTAGHSGSAFCSGNVAAYTLHMPDVGHMRQVLAEVMHALQDSKACSAYAGYPQGSPEGASTPFCAHVFAFGVLLRDSM